MKNHENLVILTDKQAEALKAADVPLEQVYVLPQALAKILADVMGTAGDMPKTRKKYTRRGVQRDLRNITLYEVIGGKHMQSGSKIGVAYTLAISRASKHNKINRQQLLDIAKEVGYANQVAIIHDLIKRKALTPLENAVDSQAN